MNLIKILNSKEFERLDQFEKNKLLNKYILQDKNSKIGLKVLCFQKEVLLGEKNIELAKRRAANLNIVIQPLAKNKWMYKKYGKAKVVTTISVGIQYEIIDYKKGKIKIINDERKEKLKKINLCQTE